jgi:flagellar biosynthetic protein FlhB
MADSDAERSEEATQQRRDDFRKRGQVAQTKELGSVLTLLASALMMWALGKFLLQECSELIGTLLTSFVVKAAREGDYVPAVIFGAKKAFMIGGPICALLMIIPIAATTLQTGLLYNEEALQFDLNKINPLEGLKRMFSVKSLIEGVKSILKIIVVGAVVYYTVRHQISQIPSLLHMDISQLLKFTGELTVRIVGAVGVFMAILAAADYFIQRLDLEKQMRMTKQEVKEEHKSREGDPMIKARIRRIQREMANKRMMSDVQKADVIITNPTHIACAIQYDPANMAAPKLLAKGADLMAEKIREIAREHNIPIVENKPLARTIFKTMKIGHAIPRELFTAVAQVLSYVYKLKRKKVF